MIVQLSDISAVRHVVAGVSRYFPAVAVGVQTYLRSGIRRLDQGPGTGELGQPVDELRKSAAAELCEIYLPETIVEPALHLEHVVLLRSMFAEVFAHRSRNGFRRSLLQLPGLGLLRFFLAQGNERVVPAQLGEAVDEAGEPLISQLVKVDVAKLGCEHRAYLRQVKPLVPVVRDECHDCLADSRLVVFLLHLADLVEVAEMVAADSERSWCFQFADAHHQLSGFSQTYRQPGEIAVAGDKDESVHVAGIQYIHRVDDH